MLSDRVFQSILPLNDRELCPYPFINKSVTPILNLECWKRIEERHMENLRGYRERC